MLLRGELLADLLDQNPIEQEDPFVIRPKPDTEAVRRSGSASIDLRLGTWITTSRQTRLSHLSIDSSFGEPLLRSHYIRFGKQFFLHPRNFVLAATLEWLRLPANLAGYVAGKSSWGRRGLVIATAVGVHPGFFGCLILELTNLGELPIEIEPGMAICQLFLHQATGGGKEVDRSPFVGSRRPILGSVTRDPFAKALAGSEKKSGT
jgi:dCTP deaminase